MSMRALILAAALLAPLPAAAQGWKLYSYGDAGFAVQLPAPPTVTKGTFSGGLGAPVPSTTYALSQPDIAYSMTVADFTQQPSIDKDAALKAALKAYGALGEIKLDVEERIDREYGRQLTLVGKDGSRSNLSVFFVNHRLYELEGKALPPEPAAGAGKAVRFQQSLEFIGLGAEAGRPENRRFGAFGGPGGQRGPGGPGEGRRQPPPPEAFAACQGKALGDAVQFTTPEGATAATCIQTPQGLAARPARPPRGRRPPPGDDQEPPPPAAG